MLRFYQERSYSAALAGRDERIYEILAMALWTSRASSRRWLTALQK